MFIARVFHFLYRRFARRALVTVSIRELMPAVLTYDLMLFLGRHRSLTLTATDEAGEREDSVVSGTRVAVASKKFLHLVVFAVRYHRRMFPAIPEAAFLRVLKFAVVERAGENTVDRASAECPVAGLSRLTGAEPPFLVRDLGDLGWAICAGEHQVPHLADEREAHGVLDDEPLAGFLFDVVQVSDRRFPGVPAVLDLGLDAAFHVLAQVVHVFLGHTEFDIHEDDVVAIAGERLSRRYHLDVVLLHAPDDRTAVHRIACQAVELPADDALGLALVETLHHAVENRTPWVLRRLRFDKDMRNGNAELRRNLLKLPLLGFDGENLPVFGLG